MCNQAPMKTKKANSGPSKKLGLCSVEVSSGAFQMQM